MKLEVILIQPDAPEQLQALAQTVAAVHAQGAAELLQALSCPTSQKKDLLNIILDRKKERR